MAADKSLKDLSGAVVKIAENSPKIQKDVKDIRDAVVGPAGILESVNALVDRLDKAEKKARIDKLRGRGARANEINNRKLLKNTDGISKNLAKILKNMDGMSGDKKKSRTNGILERILDNVRRLKGGRGDVSTRRTRLTEENFRRETRADRKLKRLEGISKTIEIIERLKGLRMRDLTFVKRKLNSVREVMSRFRNMFRMFKNQKEVDGTLNFADRSIEITEKLKKIAIISGPAKLGERTIEKIFLGSKRDRGKGGLLYLFKKIAKNTVAINVSKKSMVKILKACGSMLLTSIVLTGIAVVGIPAMLGALMMKGIVFLLIGTFKMLRKSRKSVIKGSTVMLIMSASIITFALGLGLMTKAVKDMKLKDIGLMIASVAGLGLTIAGIGLIALPVAIGSASLLLMGAALGIFGMAIVGWQKIDSKKAMGNVKEAIGGLREALGLELGNHGEGKNMFQRIGGGILDMAMAFINMGSMFFMMGTLLMAGISLGLLYHGLKKWDNFNGKKAAANIKVGVGALKDAFGIGESSKMNLGGKVKKLIGGPFDIANSIMEGGKALIEMGIITIAVGMADMIRLLLIPWNKYDPRPAAANIRLATDTLKDVFGLSGKNNNEGINAKGIKLGGNLIDLVSSIAEAGSTLAQMFTIMTSVLMLDIVKKGLEPWENYDATKPAANIKTAVDALKDTFGLDKNTEAPSLKLAGQNLFDMGIAFLQAGKTLAQIGTITIATSMLGKIKEHLEPWADFNSSKPIANIKYAVDNLLDVFGLSQIERMEKAADGEPISRAKKVLNSIGEIISAPFKVASNLAETAVNISEGGNIMTKLSNILHATSAMFSIKGALEPWDNYNAEHAFTNISDAVMNINSLFTEIVDIRNKEPRGLKLSNAKYFEVSTSSIKRGITHLADSWRKSEILKSAEVPFKKTVDIVNSVDIAKAQIMVNLFKSFSDIRKRPFDKFTESVNKFAESSSNLIDALNNFSENYEVSEGSGESGEGSSSSVQKVDGVNINNTQALAAALAEAVRSIPLNVETNISDIKLVVNGEAGRRVVITLDN